MICRFATLSRSPAVFLAMTGLRVPEFPPLVAVIEPAWQAATQSRLQRPTRCRAAGGGRHTRLSPQDQILLVVIWLRQYPTNEVLGFLFGVSDSTVSRLVTRLLPVLEAAGQDSMRMPDPGRSQRKTLDALLADTPALAVVIDTFEQRIQRSGNRETADAHYSGKKKQHTLKSQIAVDETTGLISAVAESVPGPTADIRVLKESGLLEQLPAEVGGIGDLAYLGLGDLHPEVAGASPRRKPRGKDRPPEDVAFNRAFAQRRIVVEHAINRLRYYQCLTAMDRQHRRQHTARVRAVAGLVNHQIRSRVA